jgi:hypothetical protein
VRLAPAVALTLLLLPSVAWAQLDAPAENPQDSDSAPPPEPQSPLQRYQSRVKAHPPSPEWTQDRFATSTRFWLLDPGVYEVETWLRTRVPHVDPMTGVRGPNEYLWQQEIEIGLYPHIQIDLYENLVNDDGTHNLEQEGVQVEARIAIPSRYGQMPLNPVVYLEFHPRHDAPDRAEVRLLVGGAPTRWLYLVANPYYETNVEETAGQWIADAEVGTTLAAGFRVTSWLSLNAETKIGGDMLGNADNKFRFVWWAGPGFLVKPLPGKLKRYLKIMGTCLFAMPGTDTAAQQLEPLVIVGSQW